MKRGKFSWRLFKEQFSKGFSLKGQKDQFLQQVHYTVLDTELTGLDLEHDEVLAVGALRMVGSRILVGEHFYTLVQPARERWGQSVTVYSIRPADVAAAPTPREVLPKLLAFCVNTVLVGHSVDVDRKFLEATAQRIGMVFPSFTWLDTGRVARWLASHRGTYLEAASDRGRFRLEDLLEKYGITPPTRHHALADALVTAQVWQRQLGELQSQGVWMLRDLRLIRLV